VTRTFFALEIPAATAIQLADWRDRQLGAAGRTVPPANFHITLAFMGELSGGALERLCLAVDEWVSRNAPPGGEISLDRTGFWSRPGIYWLGPSRWPDSLNRLADKLRSLGNTVGARRDRKRFQPHITLLRSCTVAPPAPAVMPAFNLAYSDFALLESRQGRSGVSYHPLQQWNLCRRG
jgi:2'-5' RNA ligase